MVYTLVNITLISLKRYIYWKHHFKQLMETLYLFVESLIDKKTFMRWGDEATVEFREADGDRRFGTSSFNVRLTNGRWLNFMLSWGEWLAIVDLLATHVYVRSAVYEFNAHMLNEILVTEEVVPKKIGVLLHDIALEKRDEWPVHGVYAKV